MVSVTTQCEDDVRGHVVENGRLPRLNRSKPIGARVRLGARAEAPAAGSVRPLCDSVTRLLPHHAGATELRRSGAPDRVRIQSAPAHESRSKSPGHGRGIGELGFPRQFLPRRSWASFRPRIRRTRTEVGSDVLAVGDRGNIIDGKTPPEPGKSRLNQALPESVATTSIQSHKGWRAKGHGSFDGTGWPRAVG